jgi:predicted nucleotidyltransferase
VSAVPGVPEEPVDRFARGTGFEVSDALRPALSRAVERAGPGLEALILSGSHASGEAVWATLEGRTVSLSDVDLYAVMRTEAAAAAARADRTPLASARERLEWGLLAPVEVAFVTLAGLARMPARPGTVELARSGRVVAGDAGVLARLPRWEPAAIDAEERLLLLENRAFELLWADAAWAGHDSPRLQARHAVLKTALELAAARTLAHGELPMGAASRVASASALGAPGGSPSWLAGAWEGLASAWQEALAWRRGGARLVSDEAQAASWRAVTRAWCVAWWAEAPAGAPVDPWERARALAARGSLARRLRRSLASPPGRPEGPGVFERLRCAVSGTPEHRIHGSAAVLMLAAAQGQGEPRLPAGALRALHTLGVTRADRFATAARETLAAWDRQLHAGDRTGELA